jgi:hypothetical protein
VVEQEAQALVLHRLVVAVLGLARVPVLVVSLIKPSNLETLVLMDLEIMVVMVNMVKEAGIPFRLVEAVEQEPLGQTECLLAVRVVKARM